MGMFACCEEIQDKKRPVSCQTSVFDFFKSCSKTGASQTVLLDAGDHHPDDLPAVLQRVSSL